MIQALYLALQIFASLGTCIWDPIYQGIVAWGVCYVLYHEQGVALHNAACSRDVLHALNEMIFRKLSWLNKSTLSVNLSKLDKQHLHSHYTFGSQAFPSWVHFWCPCWITVAVADQLLRPPSHFEQGRHQWRLPLCHGQGLLREAPEHLGLQEASLPTEAAHTPCTMCNTSGFL